MNEKLGLVSNQLWHDDPGRLSNLLARYNFVATKFAGKRSIAEVGCGDAFAARIILNSVESLTVYHPDSAFVEDIRARQEEGGQLNARLHDILAGSLPKQHDGIFSADIMQLMSQGDQHTYITNLSKSLTYEGVLIIGVPCNEEQLHPSQSPKANIVSFKSGSELNAIMKRYFKVVFIASMLEEAVYADVRAGADYIFAVCSVPI
jgi:cyclopropane fatty-acyl-phospholipid synthase-like methyltransferase